MIKTSNTALMVLISFVVGFILGMVAQRKFKPCITLPVVTIQRDTVTVRDTIRGEVQPPQRVEILRVDTVWLDLDPVDEPKKPGDTVTPPATKQGSAGPRIGQNGELLIPIQRKTYQTDNYRAVVSGWRPSLDSMEVYQETKTITNTVTKLKPARWALTAGPGVGYAAGNKVVPYIGLTVGFVIWSK